MARASLSLSDAVGEPRARRRHRRARGLHASDPARGRPRGDPPGPARPDARADDAGPDLRPADRHGLRAQARVLVGRQSRRRLAAPLPRRGRERLAGAARARGALPRRHGGRVRGGRVEPAVRRCCAATRAPTRGAHERRRRSSARSPASGSPRSRRSGPTSASSTRSAPTGKGNVQLWGILGVQKRGRARVARARSSPSRRSSTSSSRCPARR